MPPRRLRHRLSTNLPTLAYDKPQGRHPSSAATTTSVRQRKAAGDAVSSSVAEAAKSTISASPRGPLDGQPAYQRSGMEARTIVVGVVMNVSTVVGVVIFNKMIQTSHEYRHPVFMSAFHFFFTTIGTRVLLGMKFFEYKVGKVGAEGW